QGKMKKSVLINDLSQFLTENIPDMADSSSGRYINASLCSPILVEGEVIGLLNLDSTMVGAFDDSDLDLAEYMREQLEIALTRRQLYDKIVYLSRHDEVTGLYNRRFFEEFAERTLKRSRRYDEKFCLAVFDLNGLKQVNDNYGHQCGDEIIKTFAKALRESFRETDILGRYGGDEFVGIFLE
ncbi:diguanylate cyclase, partial [Aduncisulcus paluster]